MMKDDLPSHALDGRQDVEQRAGADEIHALQRAATDDDRIVDLGVGRQIGEATVGLTRQCVEIGISAAGSGARVTETGHSPRRCASQDGGEKPRRSPRN